MNILATLKEAFSAFASYFGWARQRSEVNNAPDVKAAAIAKQEQKQVDNANEAVAKQDVKETRNLLAE